ncbi:hypothetical protein AM501_11535 [Aneurinibacillus migulanus]|uniref:SMI1/KNR4 family protein n=1 Tax=Aneurinibacillus migulanus TaxID=47500 RepID=UPI0005C308B0|nr:SMI1/KNR4 family protein [Aneurinibacillus migulanus]KIV54613.1 hypothetical protein TS64_16515 [Aneurinibacillus migulanus]KPD07988.1 hypothetical protein AM501_11535 [Aneurinibacillus migulanus]MCP1358538.1 SMI1/KNR4 family protein [Aneurinibacillus migulanus]
MSPLSDSEFKVAESRYHITFSEDLRAFYKTVLPSGPYLFLKLLTALLDIGFFINRKALLKQGSTQGDTISIAGSSFKLKAESY